MASSANNVIISPMNLFWRIEANHQIKMVADVADSLDGTYFTLMGTHYVWFDGPVAADPAPAGLTAIPISYTANDSAATIAGLVQTAVDALGDFSATVVNTDSVDVIAAAVGPKDDSADVDSGVTVTICRKGKDFDLGLLEGEPTLTMEPDVLDVAAQQKGTVPATSIIRGVNASAEVVMLETPKSNLEEFYKIYGGSFTPSGGTAVFGVGTASIGNNLLIDGARLEMVPVNSISAELSYNVNIMLTAPVPGSLTFSGENVRTLAVTFKAYPDDTKDSRVDTVLIGDPTQTGI